MTAVNLNRAIRGPVTAVPVVAGKGVRLVADTVNNRFVVEADETVIMNTITNLSANLEIALTEAYTNFERIRIFFARNPNGTANSAPTVNEFIVSDTLYNISCIAVNYNNGTQNLMIDWFSAHLSGSTLTIDKFSRKNFGASSFTTETNANMTIFKIVGVNRISST